MSKHIVLPDQKKVIMVKPKLGKILEERGIKQSELALASGVPQPSISRFDRNIQHNDVHLFAIAHALGLSVADLFEVSYSDPADIEE